MLSWQRDAVSLPLVRFGTEKYLHRKKCLTFQLEGSLYTNCLYIHYTKFTKFLMARVCCGVDCFLLKSQYQVKTSGLWHCVCTAGTEHTQMLDAHTHLHMLMSARPLGVWCACQLCLGWGERGYESDSVSWFGPTGAQSSSESITQTIHEWFHCEGTVQLITVNSHCRIFSIIFRIDS